MVEIPRVPRRLVTTEGARSSVTAADISAPYQGVARALGQAAETVEDIGVAYAEREGPKAVVRDTDGNLSVEKPMPLFSGRAGAAYNRAAYASWEAQIGPEIRNQAIQAGLKYENQPQQFAEWSRNYQDELAGKQPNEEMANKVKTLTARHFGEVHNGLTLKTGHRAQENANKALSIQQETLENELTALYRGGATADDPNVNDRIEEWLKVHQERINNPVFNYTPEQAKYDRDQFYGKLGANTFLHKVKTIAEDTSVDQKGEPVGGIDKALRHADEILTRTDLNLNEQQRHQYWAKANSELRAIKAERSQDLKDAREAVSALNMQSALGMPVAADEVERVADLLRKGGDRAGVARLYASYARKPLNDEFGKQPLYVQTQQLNQGRVPVGTPTQVDALTGTAKRLGINPRDLAAAISYETGGSFDTNVMGGKGGNYMGLIQFGKEEREKYGVRPGMTIEQQMGAVENYLRDRGLKPGSGIAEIYRTINGGNPNAPLTVSDGNGTIGQHIERIKAGHYGNADRFLGGKPTGSVEDMPPWLRANRQRETTEKATVAWQTIMKDYNDKKIRPNDQAVDTVIQAARATNNADLLETIEGDLKRIGAVQGISQQPLPVQAEALGAFSAAAEAGQLSPGQSAAQKDLEQRYNAVVTGLENDPVKTTAVNFPDRYTIPPAINPANSTQFRNGLAARSQIVQFAANNWQVPARSALDSADVKAVQATLETADAPTKARIYGDIATLPEDVRNATLAKLGEKGVAAKVEAFAGALYANDPELGSSILRGQQALKIDDRYDPTKEGNKKDYQAEFDKNLPPTTFTLAGRTSDTGALSTMRAAIRARYADLSAQAADTSATISNDRVAQAVNDVTGGVLRHNGGTLIAPKRGMPQKDFDGILQNLTADDLPGVTTLAGEPITPEYIRNSARLESVGDGRYFVQLGQIPEKPLYAMQGATETHGMVTPFVLDLRGKKPPVTPARVSSVEVGGVP